MDDFTKNLSENDQDSENFKETNTSSSASREISSDLIRGHINTIILRTLIDGEKYGYEIINEIEEKSHGQYTIKQPTLYSALKRLETQGYVTSYWGGVSNGGRRRYFSLTAQGREISTKNIDEWEYSRTIIDSLISENDYDFSNPSPSAVDMKILKQSTSRVPVIHREEEKDLPENIYTPNNKVFFHIDQLNDLSECTDVSTSELPVEITDNSGINKKSDEISEQNHEKTDNNELSAPDETINKAEVSSPSDEEKNTDSRRSPAEYLYEDVDRVTINIDDEDEPFKAAENNPIARETSGAETAEDNIQEKMDNQPEEAKETLPEANQVVKNYIEDTAVFTDDDYHRLALRSKIDREYKNTLNRIYSSAITDENESENGIFVDSSSEFESSIRPQYGQRTLPLPRRCSSQ